MGKKSGYGSGMNNPDHISETLETNFWIKILKFCGSGMVKIRIRDEKNSDPGSGQHCLFVQSNRLENFNTFTTQFLADFL
jgi:hypothetical protein